jgi:hypothetical protein
MDFEFEFSCELIEWRGPAPFYFVPMPAEMSTEIKALAKVLSYGWASFQFAPASVWMISPPRFFRAKA